jgi:hypothetical protein
MAVDAVNQRDVWFGRQALPAADPQSPRFESRMTSPRIRRALISTSDKLGLADFARGLAAAGVEIYSTGGTRKYLESEGVAVVDVSTYTGFPEML